MGFADAARAERLLLGDLGLTEAGLRADPLVAAIAAAADPDLALTGLTRLFGAVARPADLAAALRTEQDFRERLAAVLGVSARPGRPPGPASGGQRGAARQPGPPGPG